MLHPPHGLMSDPPETYIIWRKEVTLLFSANVDGETSTSPETIRTKQTLEQHSDLTKRCVEKILRALKLDPALESALVIAALKHDFGKARPIWQRFARNPDSTTPLAKSLEYLHGHALGGYRHELGSIMEVVRDDAIRNHPERDLYFAFDRCTSWLGSAAF